MLSLSFLVSVLSFSNQKPCVTNPMSILYISPLTDKKTTHHNIGLHRVYIGIMEKKMETIQGLVSKARMGLAFGFGEVLRGQTLQ